MHSSARRLGLALVATALLAVIAGPSAFAADWPTNHRTNTRDGNDTSANPFNAIGQQWISSVLNGKVYVSFGGYAGDCGSYHGYLISIKADGSSTALTVFQAQAPAVCQDTTPNEAAIWGPDGPAVDASGNIYVTSGNGASTGAYD